MYLRKNMLDYLHIMSALAKNAVQFNYFRQLRFCFISSSAALA